MKNYKRENKKHVSSLTKKFPVTFSRVISSIVTKNVPVLYSDPAFSKAYSGESIFTKSYIKLTERSFY